MTLSREWVSGLCLGDGRVVTCQWGGGGAWASDHFVSTGSVCPSAFGSSLPPLGVPQWLASGFSQLSFLSSSLGFAESATLSRSAPQLPHFIAVISSLIFFIWE